MTTSNKAFRKQIKAEKLLKQLEASEVKLCHILLEIALAEFLTIELNKVLKQSHDHKIAKALENSTGFKVGNQS